MADHTERVTVTDALPWACIEGDCDHDDGNGEWDYENCPRITVEVCVDCMEEREFGRDPRWWEELVEHTDPPQPDPVPEPNVRKPSAEAALKEMNR